MIGLREDRLVEHEMVVESIGGEEKKDCNTEVTEIGTQSAQRRTEKKLKS
jgi:hypothetical protein